MTRVVAIALALVGVLATARVARADDDYDPKSPAWNGMVRTVALAEGMGFEVDPVASLEWSDLSDNDILFLVYPLQRVDPNRLSAFVQAGGNVVLADDFGDGKDAMAGLGLLRADVSTSTPRASEFYANQTWAPIATPRSDHYLTTDVDKVVTNHPSTLSHVEGGTVVVGFDDAAVVVAGERGTGRFVAISDPSIFINRMQEFRGNVQLLTNILRWLSRDGRARRVVLLTGDVAMYGEPRPYIDDPHAGELGRAIADVNRWLTDRHQWLLTPTAMKVLAAILALVLLGLAGLALPVRRGPRIDGAWLRFGRPQRRDEPHALVAAIDRSGPSRGRGNRGAAGVSYLVLACVLRDQVQSLLEDVLGKPEPIYTKPEVELVNLVATAKGALAAAAMAKVYRRLRALPSRSQAAAPWSAGVMARRDFDTLYADVAELCRTLGSPLTEAPGAPGAAS
jgi:hypothetical protein|nr:DUF4350 domain-containing protein [Kofleriaceae bacterium]